MVFTMFKSNLMPFSHSTSLWLLVREAAYEPLDLKPREVQADTSVTNIARAYHSRSAKQLTQTTTACRRANKQTVQRSIKLRNHRQSLSAGRISSAKVCTSTYTR